MKRDFVCPLCFERSSLENVYKHCSVEGHNTHIRLNFLQRMFGTSLGELICDECKKEKNIKTLTESIICPNCYRNPDAQKELDPYKLPTDLVECASSYIAVIGLRNAGKSHYIASLIQSMYEIAMDIHWDFSCPDERTTKNFKDRYGAWLYNRLEVLPSTRKNEEQNIYGKRPLIYTLEFMPPHKQRKFACFFYDSAGEDLENSNVSDLVETLKYMKQACGIILLVDPMQLPGVRASDKMEDYINRYKIEQQKNACTVSELLRKMHDILPKKKGSDKNSIPVAVAFSKIDALKEFFGEGSSVFQSSSYEDKTIDHRVNLQTLIRIDTEMREWLNEYQGDDDVLGTAENCFDKTACFGVSALGNGVLSSSNPGHLTTLPRPYNCLDPLLWILYQNGFLKGK